MTEELGPVARAVLAEYEAGRTRPLQDVFEDIAVAHARREAMPRQFVCRDCCFEFHTLIELVAHSCKAR